MKKRQEMSLVPRQKELGLLGGSRDGERNWSPRKGALKDDGPCPAEDLVYM